MGIYTVSSCFLKNINAKIYLTDVLLKFTQQNSHRVAIDKDKHIIDLYRIIALERPEIAWWLDFMSYDPSSFEEIVSLPKAFEKEIEVFLFICKSTVSQKKIIVHSSQLLEGYEFIDAKKIRYDNNLIIILERDDAIEEFKEKKKIIKTKKYQDISGSVIADKSSTIKGAKIEKN